MAYLMLPLQTERQFLESLLHINAATDISLAPMNSNDLLIADGHMSDILDSVALVHTSDCFWIATRRAFLSSPSARLVWHSSEENL